MKKGGVHFLSLNIVSPSTLDFIFFRSFLINSPTPFYTSLLFGQIHYVFYMFGELEVGWQLFSQKRTIQKLAIDGFAKGKSNSSNASSTLSWGQRGRKRFLNIRFICMYIRKYVSGVNHKYRRISLFRPNLDRNIFFVLAGILCKGTIDT